MPCGCLVFLIGIAFPRIAVILLWFFTFWVNKAFAGGILLPLLGLIFLPYTLLWYVIVMNAFHGVWGFWQVALMVIAIILDLSSHGGGARAYSRRSS